MSGRGSRRIAARLLSAAASAALVGWPALAQTVQTPAQSPPPPDAAELDPSAPLAPMPDLGVDWPDLNTREAQPAPQSAGPKGQAAASAVTDENSEIRYTVEVEGL